MQLLTTVADVRAALAAAHPVQVGLVPTMGNLHEGHLSLVEASRRACDLTVVSVFVNPMQFGPNEDFEAYPRTLAEDAALLEACGADMLFAPSDDEMYPHGRAGHTRVSVPRLASILCGTHRPGHFDGVATVVLKLFNIVTPQRAFFGEKDYQQLTLIKTVCSDLNLPVEIIGVPTVRSEDGLALSSRNRYLSSEERARAPLIQQTLIGIATALARGEREFRTLEGDATARLTSQGFSVDYISILNAMTLETPKSLDRDLVVLAAARIGRTRLIDNLRIRV